MSADFTLALAFLAVVIIEMDKRGRQALDEAVTRDLLTLGDHAGLWHGFRLLVPSAATHRKGRRDANAGTGEEGPASCRKGSSKPTAPVPAALFAEDRE